MKRLLLFLLPVVLAIVVFVGLVVFLNRKTSGSGALQVTTLPQATVYINGSVVGKTPLCKCEGKDMLASGEYTIKLVPADTSLPNFEDKITIYPGVLTVVDRTFGQVGKASGSILTLVAIDNKNSAQLSVTSFPFDADVSVDGNIVGKTPTSTEVTESDHEISISKLGYKSKTIRIHGVKGYKLVLHAELGADLSVSASPEATSAAALIPTATPTPSGPTGLILDTPTGFLRVRESPSLSASESAQVKPGEVYPIVATSTEGSWYQIQLKDGTSGWVSASYVKKQGN